jgi:hypothetical protein
VTALLFLFWSAAFACGVVFIALRPRLGGTCAFLAFTVVAWHARHQHSDGIVWDVGYGILLGIAPSALLWLIGARSKRPLRTNDDGDRSSPKEA